MCRIRSTIYIIKYKIQIKAIFYSLLNTSNITEDLFSVFGLKDALGGTLRQCLCIKENLDFNNTAFVDLGDLSWSYDPGNTQFYSNIIEQSSTGFKKVMCSKYKYVISDYATVQSPHTRGVIDGRVYIIDTTYTDATTLKAAMKGVLLAYEKTSS